MRIFNADEVRGALDAAHEFRGFVEVCVFAGLGLGEAAGLQRQRRNNAAGEWRRVREDAVCPTR
ncbi:hypothetical protein [Microbacterium sp.]|uniref:hypothetical protein n=1 Tax=Microbacterium sp. TaxID=51671 RepID=UPI0035B0992E